MNNIVMAPAEESRARRYAKTCTAVITASLLCSILAEARPSCPRELGTTDITLIKSMLQLRGAAQAPKDQQCTVYRQHVATVSKAREVFDRCLSGAHREVDLRQLDGALDGAIGVIARVCER